MQGMYFRIFFPKQSQDFKPSEAQLYPNTGRVPPEVLANFITCLSPGIPRKNCCYPIHPKARVKTAVSQAASRIRSIFASLFVSRFLRLRTYIRKRARVLQFQFSVVNVSRKCKREKTHTVFSQELSRNLGYLQMICQHSKKMKGILMNRLSIPKKILNLRQGLANLNDR